MIIHLKTEYYNFIYMLLTLSAVYVITLHIRPYFYIPVHMHATTPIPESRRITLNFILLLM